MVSLTGSSGLRTMQGLANPMQLENLRVVLVSTRNPLNIGAAARAMSNFGALHLRVVNPFDPSFREAKSAVGASELLQNAEAFAGVAEAVADCSLVIGTTAARDRELQHPLHALPAAAPLIRGQLAKGRIAILFGSEKRGLSNHDLSYCDWLLQIPTRAEHPSMNLSQSVAVCLYELIRDETRSAATPELADAAERERLATVLGEVLIASDYLKGSKAEHSGEKLRRFVHRLQLAPEDAETLLAMLRKVLWKLKREA